MSDFYSNFKKAEEARAARQANGGSQTFAKIGFFGTTKDASGNRVKYMTRSGDSALVRINYGNNPSELLGESYGLHSAASNILVNGRPYQKIACLGPGACPICNAIAAGDKAFGKATQRVFIPMVVAYKLPDGTYTTPEPVVMDGAAYLVDKLVNTMQDFGPLRDSVFKLTRTGVGTDTRYDLSFIPTFNNENIITKASLSAFDNFDVSRHSYWKKTAEEITTFYQTGSFPEVTKAASAETAPAAAPQEAPVYSAPAYSAPAYNAAQPVVSNPAPVAQPQPTADVKPWSAPAQEPRRPAAAPVADSNKDFNFSANW